MSLKQRGSWSGSAPERASTYVGHAHFWERAVSRGVFIKAAAGVTGAVLGAELWMPDLARASKVDLLGPRPIPGSGVGQPFHVFLPGAGSEPSSITDFNGFVGVAHVTGTGTASDGVSNFFDADMRFMQGLYIGLDGLHHQGTFSFV